MGLFRRKSGPILVACQAREESKDNDRWQYVGTPGQGEEVAGGHSMVLMGYREDCKIGGNPSNSSNLIWIALLAQKQ